jgi:NAD(P)-dependent dehydrogenase (short-subunit alcohol dehydrogenase family)
LIVGTLDGKVALVTGGAGGIGSATARRMAAEGARVVVVDIDGVAIDEALATITDTGGVAVGFTADVSDPDAAREMIAFASATFGRLDVLHNNAAAGNAVGRDSDVVAVELAIWDEILAVNLTGPMLGCRFAIPEMLKTGGGVILNTASVAGQLAEREHVTYGVSKAGLILLTKHVAVRYGKRGIRCNAIAPGVVLTPRARARRDPAWIEGMADIHHSARLGDPDDIAQVATFLASDGGAFVNGAVLNVDGGLTALLPGLGELLTGHDPSAVPDPSALPLGGSDGRQHV